jgi:LPXTG-motif cell wall-anchored protein
VKAENQNQDVSKKQSTQDTRNTQNASCSSTKSVDNGKSSTEQAKKAPKSVPAVSSKTDKKTESKTTVNEAKHTEATKESSVEAKADPKGPSSEIKDGGDKPITTKKDTDQTASAEKTEAPHNEGVAPAEKDLPAADQDDAQKTTNEAKQPTKAGLVKIPQVDKKAVDEDPFLKSTSDKRSANEEKLPVDQSKKRSVRKEIPSTEQYRLRGIDAHGKELFNKAVDLTKDDAADFQAKNVEFYGYDLVDSEYNKETKTFILHYQAKKVTFHIIITDEEGKPLSKETLQMEFGDQKTYTPKNIPGYQANDSSKVLKADNLLPDDVTFTYSKLPEKQQTTESHDKTRGKARSKASGDEHQHTLAEKGDVSDEHSSDSDESDEKLPQTGESHSFLGALSGLALLFGLIGKKLFKRDI